MIEMYVLADARHRVIARTAATNAREAWVKSFDYLCEKVPGFREKYMYKWKESQDEALRLGYRLMEAGLVTGKQADMPAGA